MAKIHYEWDVKIRITFTLSNTVLHPIERHNLNKIRGNVEAMIKAASELFAPGIQSEYERLKARAFTIEIVALTCKLQGHHHEPVQVPEKEKTYKSLIDTLTKALPEQEQTY